MRRTIPHWKLGLVLLFGFAPLLFGIRSFAQGDNPERADITLEGEATNGWSYAPALSSDGRYLAYTSTADNLVQGDFNLAADVFISDRRTSQTRLASISTRGEQGNAWSFQPELSANGRYVAFTSLADNLSGPYQESDTNGLADVFVRDRGTSTTLRASIRSDGSEEHGWSDQPTISGDGRYVAFVSTASDLGESPSPASTNIYVHDRQSRKTWSITAEPVLEGQFTSTTAPSISTSGRYIAYLAAGADGERVAIHDIVSGQTRFVPEIGSDIKITGRLSRPGISADGRYIAILAGSGELSIYDQFSGEMLKQQIPIEQINHSGQRPGLSISANGGYITLNIPPGIFVYDRESGQIEELQITSPPAGVGDLDLSRDGRHLAFTAAEADPGLYLYDRGETIQDMSPVTGWVSDGQGHPLVGVTVSTERGTTTKTDANGNFYFVELRSGHHDISPEREGFTFSPSAYRFTLDANHPASPGLAFIGLFEGIVPEAALDIGMPYALDRGCESPFEECGGPYHGFYRGDCTDLVMDAYREGVDFDIQAALMYDFRLNPHHYYRWHNARNSHDMYRFFSYTGQLIPPDEPYLPGDIVFFDWEADSVVDHVAIVSDVNEKNQPLKLIDATGVIDENPSGAAIELDWKPYHDSQTPGHARWTGLYSSRENGSPQDKPVLLVALDSPSAEAKLYDMQDNSIPSSAQGINGGRYRRTGTGQVISIDHPLENSDLYLLEVRSDAEAPYSLGVQTVQGGLVNQVYTVEGFIGAGETILLPLTLAVEDGRLGFTIQAQIP